MLLWFSGDVANAEEKEGADGQQPADDDDGPQAPEPPALEAKYLIVGGGTAAFSAIKELKRLDPSAKVQTAGEAGDSHSGYRSLLSQRSSIFLTSARLSRRSCGAAVIPM